MIEYSNSQELFSYTLKNFDSYLMNMKIKEKINIENYKFDDEFVTLINLLSNQIKDYFKFYRGSSNQIKNSSNSVI